MHELASYTRFQVGRSALKSKDYEGAINAFADLLKELTEKHGDSSIEIAPAYFEYGNALLTKEEENPSYGLLGDAAEKAKVVLPDGREGVPGSGGGEDEEDDEDNGNNEEEEEEVEVEASSEQKEEEAKVDEGGWLTK